MAITKRKGDDGVSYGNYRISLYLGKDKDGNKQTHWETFSGNQQQARDRETELKNEKRLGKFIKPGKLTVSDFLEKWLRDYSNTNVSPRVHEVYSSIIKNHISPALGKIPLASLTTPRLSEYYSDKVKGLKAQTVVHHHTLLHKAFQTAIEWGLLLRNPADGAKPPKVQKLEMQVWNTEEVNRFLTAAKDTEYYALFHLALFTGMRRSELLALRWKDVDLIFGQVSVNRAYLVLQKHRIVYRQPKTAKSKRQVALTPSSILALTDYYNYCKDLYNKLDMELTDDTPLFCNPATGEPYRPDTVTRAWTRIADIAGIKHIRLHDARHTHASLMLKQGVHPKIVQERLGHSSIQITLDTYSHVTPSMQQAAAKSFDDAFKTNRDCQNIATLDYGKVENS
jgi:integrase